MAKGLFVCLFLSQKTLTARLSFQPRESEAPTCSWATVLSASVITVLASSHF